ncbi:MAG: hypothetical protein A2Z12_08485 [Actinobacteria bacterium RBG_16_68_21]|nr:MAG: hypothetical protein A2Z12_08485 [Actinobacteria bacterium RBG_16_68_21]
MLREHPDGVVVAVWAVPGGSRDAVGGVHDGALRVRTSAPPEGGEANRAVARLVAAALGGRRGRVIGGHGSRRKQVLVEGVSLGAAAMVLDELRSGS